MLELHDAQRAQWTADPSWTSTGQTEVVPPGGGARQTRALVGAHFGGRWPASTPRATAGEFCICHDVIALDLGDQAQHDVIWAGGHSRTPLILRASMGVSRIHMSGENEECQHWSDDDKLTLKAMVPTPVALGPTGYGLYLSPLRAAMHVST